MTTKPRRGRSNGAPPAPGTNAFGEYEREVARQCRFIRKAIAELRGAVLLSNRAQAAELMVYHAQQLLTDVGIASLLLWGPRDNDAVAHERAPLRDHLGVDDSSILKSRAVRDSLAHIDERISEAMQMPTVTTIRIGSGRDADPSVPVMRRYNPSTDVLGFGKDEIPLAVLEAEAIRISDAFDAAYPVMRTLRGNRPEAAAAELQAQIDRDEGAPRPR
jgi:hypothetical protein